MKQRAEQQILERATPWLMKPPALVAGTWYLLWACAYCYDYELAIQGLTSLINYEPSAWFIPVMGTEFVSCAVL